MKLRIIATLVFVLLFAVWQGTRVYAVVWRIDGAGALALTRGGVVRIPEVGLARLYSVGVTTNRERVIRPFGLEPLSDRDKFGNLFVGLWPFVAASLLFASWTWLRRIAPNAAPGTCKTCGYSLQGNVSGTCPECGTAAEPKTEGTV